MKYYNPKRMRESPSTPKRAKILLIDGLNAVHAIFGSWPDSREEQNIHAVDFIARLSHWMSQNPNLEVEIVFDGGYRLLQNRANAQLRVLFSDHESADSIIIERARALRYFQKKVTVVTWDRALAEEARREEASVISPERLWEDINH
jgi:predicted RNA-binding protein with PIN domain